MRAAKFVPLIAISIAFLFGAVDRSGAQSESTKATQVAQGAEKNLKPPKAKTTVLMVQKLDGMPGFVVQVVLVEGPPGWVGGRHYHPGHLFGYVIEGTFMHNFDGLASQTIPTGKVFYENPGSVMRSRNDSSTEVVKNVVFQILREDQSGAFSVK